MISALFLGVAHIYEGSKLYDNYMEAAFTTQTGEAEERLQQLGQLTQENPPEQRQQAFERYFEQQYPSGLRYIFLQGSHGHPDIEVGQPLSTRDMLCSPRYRTTATDIGDDRILSVSPPAFGPVMGVGQTNPFTQTTEHIPPRLERCPDGVFPPPRRKSRAGKLMPALKAQEFISLKSLETKRQGHRTRWMSVIDASVMLLGSIILWLLLWQHQRAEEALKRQRVLATLGQMSTLLTQELQQPLELAKAQAQQLKDVLQHPKQQTRASRVIDELERIGSLSKNLLDFIHSGHIERGHHPCAPFLERLTREIGSPRLKVSHKHLPATFYFDPITLNRALSNLIHNALSLSPDHAPVELHVEGHGGMLSFSVRDHGPGLPEGLDILKPFVTTRERGTGLGLAISAQVVHAHHGTLNAQDHPDGGALLSFTISSDPAQVMT